MTAPRAVPGRPVSLLIGLATIGAVAVGMALAKGVADPDTFWHLTTGRLILESGVPATDPFSYTWLGQPWTDHEWLGQVVIVLLVDALGVTATVVVLTLFVLLGLASVAFALAGIGARTGAIVAATSLSMLAIVPWLTVRPQVISWAMLGLLTAFLLAQTVERPRRILWLVPTFLLWANLHGLWVVGLGVVAIWLFATLLGVTPMRGAARWAVAGGIGAVAATAVTPAGPVGILYPLRYVDAGDWGLANIAEWQSPDFHDPANFAFLLLVGSLLLLGMRGLPRWLAALTILAVVGGLVSVRNVPVAAVLAMPAVAIPLTARLRAPRALTHRTARRRLAMEAMVGLLVSAVALVVLVPLARVDLEARSPVAGADVLLTADPDARVFTEYGWGGYLISRLHPTGGLVYIDGRNDMYTDEILRSWQAAREASAGWQATLRESGTTAILLEPDAPLVTAAAIDGWCEVHRDSRQILLLEAPAEGCG